jgi:hypothetical protein
MSTWTERSWFCSRGVGELSACCETIWSTIRRNVASTLSSGVRQGNKLSHGSKVPSSAKKINRANELHTSAPSC